MDISVIIGYFFASIIFLYFLFCIFKVNSQKPKHIVLVDNATIALSTIGILGTFLGIFLGLKDFNIDEIDKSVPALIEGLKFAFFSSICGIFFSWFALSWARGQEKIGIAYLGNFLAILLMVFSDTPHLRSLIKTRL